MGFSMETACLVLYLNCHDIFFKKSCSSERGTARHVLDNCIFLPPLVTTTKGVLGENYFS